MKGYRHAQCVPCSRQSCSQRAPADLASTSPEPTNIKTASLTHLFYAFADISTDSSTIKFTNSYADEQVCDCVTSEDDGVTNMSCAQQKYPGDSSSESGTNLYGALKQVR